MGAARADHFWRRRRHVRSGNEALVEMLENNVRTACGPRHARGKNRRMARDLSGLGLLVIQIDGIHMTIGADANGDEHLPGLVRYNYRPK